MARLLSVLLITSLAWSSVARADEPLTAKQYFERGSALFALGKFADAAAQYERAFELKPDPALLYNAAQAHRLAGNKPRALQLYSSLMRVYGREFKQQAEVKQRIAELQAAIEHDKQVSTAPPTGTQPVTEPQPEHSTGTTTTATTATTTAAPEGAVTTRAAPRRDKPLVKKPWFWAVVGGGVVVVAGVAVGIALGTQPKDPSPSFGRIGAN